MLVGGVWRTDIRPSSVWAGDMTDDGYPNARVQLEIYGGGSGILRTIYGWFPVTRFVSSTTSLTFDVDATTEVPPSELDRKIVQRAAAILSSDGVWNRADNRVCPASATKWSIYCAMEKATAEISGGVDHRRPALEVVREIVEQRSSGRNYHHRLMDYNNDRRTTLADVRSLFDDALARMNDTRWLHAHGFA
jgi:hypothetical protein